MKHLLTAALIATALASPVSAQEVTLNCRLIGTSSEHMNFSLTIDTETWSATWRRNFGLEIDAQTIAYDDTQAIWAVVLYFPDISAEILHLNRANLRLQAYAIHPDDFGWADDGYDKPILAYQCSSGI